MKIELWAISKTKEKYLLEGIDLYLKRLKHYTQFSINEIVIPKEFNKLPPGQLKEKEGAYIISKIDSSDYLIILDEKGKTLKSTEFSRFIEKQMVQGRKKLIFLIGGAYGFSDDIYKRANFKLSLSCMTFSHQMIRLFFVEQLYRAFTIIRKERYHND